MSRLRGKRIDAADALRHGPGMTTTKLDLAGLKCPLPALKTRKALKSIAAVMAELGWGTPDGCHACRPALNYYLLCAWPGEYRDDSQSRLVNERLHANIQRDGTYSVVPRMWGGLTSAKELRAIADAGVHEQERAPAIGEAQVVELGLEHRVSGPGLAIEDRVHQLRRVDEQRSRVGRLQGEGSPPIRLVQPRPLDGALDVRWQAWHQLAQLRRAVYHDLAQQLARADARELQQLRRTIRAATRNNKPGSVAYAAGTR